MGLHLSRLCFKHTQHDGKSDISLLLKYLCYIITLHIGLLRTAFTDMVLSMARVKSCCWQCWMVRTHLIGTRELWQVTTPGDSVKLLHITTRKDDCSDNFWNLMHEYMYRELKFYFFQVYCNTCFFVHPNIFRALYICAVFPPLHCLYCILSQTHHVLNYLF